MEQGDNKVKDGAAELERLSKKAKKKTALELALESFYQCDEGQLAAIMNYIRVIQYSLNIGKIDLMTEKNDRVVGMYHTSTLIEKHLGMNMIERRRRKLKLGEENGTD